MSDELEGTWLEEDRKRRLISRRHEVPPAADARRHTPSAQSPHRSQCRWGHVNGRAVRQRPALAAVQRARPRVRTATRFTSVLPG